MQYALKLAGFYLKPGNAQEMFYTDDNGELFIGRVKDVDIGRTYQIEVGISGSAVASVILCGGWMMGNNFRNKLTGAK